MSHKCHHGTIYSLQIQRQNELQRILSFMQLLCFLFCAVNVAYGKASNISSRYSNQAGQSGPGCMAVNGKTGTTWMPVENNGGSCIHTATNDNNPWWLVDLGLNYSVFDVTIYNRIGKEALRWCVICLLYTSPSPRDDNRSRMPSSA